MTHCDATTTRPTAEGDLTGYKKYAKSQLRYKMQCGESESATDSFIAPHKKRRTGDVLSRCEVRRVSGLVWGCSSVNGVENNHFDKHRVSSRPLLRLIMALELVKAHSLPGWSMMLDGWTSRRDGQSLRRDCRSTLGRLTSRSGNLSPRTTRRERERGRETSHRSSLPDIEGYVMICAASRN